jgi:hypothetical protein
MPIVVRWDQANPLMQMAQGVGDNRLRQQEEADARQEQQLALQLAAQQRQAAMSAQAAAAGMRGQREARDLAWDASDRAWAAIDQRGDLGQMNEAGRMDRAQLSQTGQNQRVEMRGAIGNQQLAQRHLNRIAEIETRAKEGRATEEDKAEYRMILEQFKQTGRETLRTMIGDQQYGLLETRLQSQEAEGERNRQAANDRAAQAVKAAGDARAQSRADALARQAQQRGWKVQESEYKGLLSAYDAEISGYDRQLSALDGEKRTVLGKARDPGDVAAETAALDRAMGEIRAHRTRAANNRYNATQGYYQGNRTPYQPATAPAAGSKTAGPVGMNAPAQLMADGQVWALAGVDAQGEPIYQSVG